MEPALIIKCPCGREVRLEILGGQYQSTYQGDCICARKWSVEEVSESLIEIQE